MSQDLNEQLSAFMDGELPAAEEELLLRRLGKDAEHRKVLARYAAAGMLMRGRPPVADAASLSARISDAISAEEAHAGGAAKSGGGWQGLATAGVAAAAGLVVLSGLLSLGTVSVDGPQVASEAPAPAVRTAERSVPVSPAPALPPARLTGYLVSHGDYAGGLSRQVMSSHVVNRSPDFMLASATGGFIDE